MSPELVGITGILVLFLLFGCRVPVGFALGIVGFLGFGYVVSFSSSLSLLGMFPVSTTASYTLSVVPLFVLMGEFLLHAGLGQDIYDTARLWVGHLHGGLAMATIGGCAAFGCVTGSSVATVATMGRVSLPEMQRYNYNPSLATGTIAAGGGLGMLIPPSMILIIYGVIATQSIGQLLIAGILPGLLLAAIYMVSIYIRVRLKPALGPPMPRASFKERFIGLKGIWGVILLFVLVIGGIYTGIFTPTEASGIGAFGALLFCIARRRLGWHGFYASLLQTARTTAMIFLIIIGASIFGAFMMRSGIPTALVGLIGGIEMSRYFVLTILLFGYLALGCFMEALSMMVLTVPIILPLILELGFDPIWFGIIILMGQEMAMITPPVGLNVFVMAGIAKDVPMPTIFRGIFPFLLCIVACIIILTAFPQIVLVLPSLMYR